MWADEVRESIAHGIEQCYSDVSNPTLQTDALEAALQTKIDEGEMAALTIGDGTITTAKIANGAITQAKLDPNISFEADDELDATSTNAVQNKVVAGAISALNESLDDIRGSATGSDIGKVLTVKSVANNKVSEWEFTTPESGGGEGSGDGLSDAIKTAILNCFEHVAWTDNQGQTYYDELEELLFPTGTLTGISVTYSNQNPVPEGTTLNDLRQYLTVVAYYSGGTSETVNAYTLSGTLTVGTNQITVTYQGKTARFNVQVATTPKSDMNGWTDGVAYTDLEVVADSYYTNSGGISPYNGWNRTGMVPCDGATSITLKANGNGSSSKDFCWFFDANKVKIQRFNVGISRDNDIIETVPSGAYFFGISASAAIVTAQINAGIIPNA